MTIEISSDFPGGNIAVKHINEREILLDVDRRDSSGDWFYWCFKAKFDEVGTYSFCFTSPNKVGTRGPALSFDKGRSWRWLSPGSAAHDAQQFVYTHDGAQSEVLFCMGMQYLASDWKRFLKEFGDGLLYCRSETLCISRKGRPVELFSIREGAPRHTLLLTSRHHAGEMMANHALEGILRAVLVDDAFGRAFRETLALYAVPFIDKDGVEAGDQGKNRIPRDHARDYAGRSIYPETAAVRSLIDRVRPDFVLDMHCPWIRGGTSNEMIYFVGSANPKTARSTDIVSEILEKIAPKEAPFFGKNNIPFGTSWNTAANFRQGFPIRTYAETLDFVRCSQTIEIPFANCEEVTLDRAAMLVFGRALAETILEYYRSTE
ncbi:MAG: hypothetical protein WCT05_14705 [Lentisphaeria bacterium]